MFQAQLLGSSKTAGSSQTCIALLVSPESSSVSARLQPATGTQSTQILLPFWLLKGRCVQPDFELKQFAWSLALCSEKLESYDIIYVEFLKAS